MVVLPRLYRPLLCRYHTTPAFLAIRRRLVGSDNVTSLNPGLLTHTHIRAASTPLPHPCKRAGTNSDASVTLFLLQGGSARATPAFPLLVDAPTRYPPRTTYLTYYRFLPYSDVRRQELSCNRCFIPALHANVVLMVGAVLHLLNTPRLAAYAVRGLTTASPSIHCLFCYFAAQLSLRCKMALGINAWTAVRVDAFAPRRRTRICLPSTAA